MYILKQIKNLFENSIYLSLRGPGFEGIQIMNESDNNENKFGVDNSNKETNDVLSKIEELQNELDSIDATRQYVSKAGSHLDRSLSPEDYSDPEAKQTIELLESYKKQFKKALEVGKSVEVELNNLKEEIQRLENNFEFNSNIDYDTESLELIENKISNEKLKTITNHEFLSLNKEERLQYVTKNHIDAENISNGSIDDVEFNFNFDGIFNKELYRLTTAGQVLPDEVNEVFSGGKIYTREGVSGEFFNGTERLKIHTGTKIEISELLTTEQLEEKEKEIDKKLEKVDEKDKLVYKEALSRGIEDKELLTKISSISSVKGVKLEEIFTHLSRLKGIFESDYSSNKLKSFILKNDLENLDKIYSIEKDKSSNLENETRFAPNKNETLRTALDGIYSNKGFSDIFLSNPYEKSDDGDTLCSKTARLNLYDLGVPQNLVAWENSAIKSMYVYDQKNNIVNNLDNIPSNIDVLDLYVYTKSIHEHRASAYLQNGVWYVSDPYYKFESNKENPIAPIPLSEYMASKKIIGAFGFKSEINNLNGKDTITV